MSNKKKKLPFNKLIIWLVLLSFLLTALMPLFAHAIDKQEILSEINRKKDTLAAKLKETRLKEAYATDKLRSINHKLYDAQNQLKQNRRYLENNKSTWQKTKKRLEDVESKQKELEGEAKLRVLSIYKQNRLKMIEGLVNSPSATDYLDHVYYQKRIMEYDKQVLDALVDQSQNIKKYKEMLAEEAVKIQTVTQKLQSIESEIAQQRAAQTVILTRLQNERRVYEESERQLERESVKLIYKISELSSGAGLDNPDATGKFMYPVKARITSPFGPRRHPIFGVVSMHSGIDLAAPRGTEIKAAEGGTVIYAGWYGGYGRVAIIDHSKGFSTLYAHLESINVRLGQRIKQGDIVGHEGTTGYSTGPHLHFEVRSKGKPQNPVSFLQDG